MNTIIGKYELEKLTTEDGRIALKVYNNKARLAHKRLVKFLGFRDEAHRDQYINNLRTNVEAREARKKQSALERKNFSTSLQVGDIVGTCWGYDQTNREYYKILEVLGSKKVKIRRIALKIVEGTGPFSANVMPQPNVFHENEPEKVCSVKVGNYVKVGHYSFNTASKWDGRPEHMSWGA